MQLDEKWSFVFKKHKRCSEEELEGEQVGDCWDHIAFDPEHRLVLGVIFGRREQRNIQKLVQEVRKRLEGRVPRLITSDGYAAYAEVFRRVYSVVIKPVHKRGEPNPGGARRVLLPGLTFATVSKEVKKGRVVKVRRELVLGKRQKLKAALAQSAVSEKVNTAFVERHNATDRQRNARKTRKTYRFSKDWEAHAAAGYFILYSYNFCWCVRTLRVKRKDGTHQRRTPAMAAGLSDHVWSVGEWLLYPAVGDSS